MAQVTVEFTFKCGDDEVTEFETFDTDLGFDDGDIATFADEYCTERNDELDGLDDEDDDGNRWECADHLFSDWDDDYGDPSDFDHLAAYVEFCDNVDKHGQGYRLRFEDIGAFDFDDQYAGEFRSVEDWAESFYEDCYGIPDHLRNHIDWESVANDLSMDYSVYEGGNGVFIFRD